MSETSLFYKEEETVQHGLRLLAGDPSQPQAWRAHYAELLSEYERLLSQERRIVRLADLMQQDLNVANEALQGEAEHRKTVETQREELIEKLTASLEEVKKLSGLLPICAACKKIRSDEGYWQEIEAYIRDHSDADFTHSICPDCARRLYPELFDMSEKK